MSSPTRHPSRWSGPPLGDPNRLNVTYWTARWWIVRNEGLRGAVIAMHEQWRRDRVKLAAIDAKNWFRSRHQKYKRHLLRLSNIVHAAGGPCAYCGDPNPRTIDHVDPELPRGGLEEQDNLVRCCRQCNSEKGNRTPDAWKRWRLANGMAWPPQPSDTRPHIPERLSGVKVSPAQMDVLGRLAEKGASCLDCVQFITIDSMERHGFIERTPERWSLHELTDRGRLALETGRIPR